MAEPEGSMEASLMIKRFDPLYWKHAIWKMFSGVAVVVLGSLPTILLNWDTMLPSGKLVALSGVAVTALKALDMLFDQTMARLAAGKLPIQLPGQNGHDTQHVQKQHQP